MFWWLSFILIVLFVYLKYLKPLNFWEQEGVPYLKPWPIVGNMLPFLAGRIPIYYLIKNFYNAMHKRYFGIWNFSEPVLIVRDIELAKQICIKDFDHFVDHKNFFNETNEPVFSENLFAAKGQRWRDLRATLSPAFTGSKMRSMFTLISECSERYTNFFLKAMKTETLDIEVKNILKKFTIDVIGTCAYGVESNSVEDENNDFYRIGQDVSDFTGVRRLKTLGFMICPALMRAMKITFFSQKQIGFFRDLVTKTIDYKEKNCVVRPDLIHLMMQARKGQLKFEDPVYYSDTGFATIEESEVVYYIDILGDLSLLTLRLNIELKCRQGLYLFLFPRWQ